MTPLRSQPPNRDDVQRGTDGVEESDPEHAGRDFVLQGGSGLGKQLHKSSCFTGVWNCEARGISRGKCHQGCWMQGYLHVEPEPFGLTVVISLGSTQLRYKRERIAAVVLIPALQHSRG